MPVCAASTSASTRSTPAASASSPAATAWSASWPASPRRRPAGFAPVKVNAVIIRGVNEQDVVPLARFGREHGLELRFIEYMPIGAEHWERDKVFFAHEMLEQIEGAVAPLVPAEDYDPRAPAMEFRYTEGGGGVGIIASVSRPFCRSCNRLRLTAEGKLRNCLFALDEIDVKPLLRRRADDGLWPRPSAVTSGRSGRATKSIRLVSSSPCAPCTPSAAEPRPSLLPFSPHSAQAAQTTANRQGPALEAGRVPCSAAARRLHFRCGALSPLKPSR